MLLLRRMCEALTTVALATTLTPGCAVSTHRLYWHAAAFDPMEYTPPQTAHAAPPSVPPAGTVVVATPGLPGEAVVQAAVGPLQLRALLPVASPVATDYVASTAPFPVQVTEEAGWYAPVDGFLAGIDLRGFRSIAFVVDVAGPMCDTLTDHGERYARMDRVGEQLAAALRGLPPTTDFHVIWGAGGNVSEYVPTSQAGRARAQALATGMFCDVGWSMTWALRRAFDEHPEVVVLVSDLLTVDDFRAGIAGNPNHPRTATPPADDDPLDAVARWPDRVPVLSVSLTNRHPDRLRRLADLTGGAYVSRIF